jgi:hypothetical protein
MPGPNNLPLQVVSLIVCYFQIPEDSRTYSRQSLVLSSTHASKISIIQSHQLLRVDWILVPGRARLLITHRYPHRREKKPLEDI